MTRSFKSTITSSVAAAAIIAALSGSAFADGLNARINAGQLAQGEAFQLTLSSEGQGGAAPDLAPLEQDFDVLGTSQSQQTQIINGRMSQRQSWIVTLSPRDTGTVTIPAIHAGALSSDPITVQVVDASQLPKLQGASGISLAASIDPGAHYVFEEIPLTVRIESAADLQRAELIAPQGDFELTQTGQDRSSQITRRGRPVTVVERSYLLRPQSEGAITVPPFTLRGTIRDPNARRDPFGGGFGRGFGSDRMQQMMERMGMGGFGTGFGGSMFDDMFNPGKPFAARSDAIKLNVLANPNAGTASEWFLPAKAVELQADWTPANPVFREGEAVTRQIRLTALGARPEQLPDLSFPEPEGARIYLDDSSTDMVETENGTVAQRVFTLSIVPTRGGEITLPEITLDWMNTESDQAEVARLPALTLTAKGTPPAAAAPTATHGDSATGGTPALDAEGRNTGYWIAPVLAILATVLAAGWFWTRRRASRKTMHSEPPAHAPWAELQSAAKRNDCGTFHTALMALRMTSQSASPPVDPAAIDEALARLDAYGFAPGGTSSKPDLSKILHALRHGKQRAEARFGLQKRNRALPPLYPSA